MRTMYVVVSEDVAKDLKLETIRENNGGEYLLRNKDIMHLQGDSLAEKAERLGGYILTQSQASKFLNGKLTKKKDKL